MAFFLTDTQEDALNLFLDRQNSKVCEEQLNSDELDEELKEIVRKTVEAGSPIPAFDPRVGYYSISFTPCEKGNRIYVHHHLTNVSEEIYDPLLDESLVTEETKLYSAEVIPDEEGVSDFDMSKLSAQELEGMFGSPPPEVQSLFATANSEEE